MEWDTEGTHVLLKPELLGNVADLLQGGLWALQKHALQVAPHSVLDARPFSLSGLHQGLCFAYLGRWGGTGKEMEASNSTMRTGTRANC